MTREGESQTKHRSFPIRCANCGKKSVAPAVVPYTCDVKHEGKTHAVTVPDLHVLKCAECSKVFLSNDANDQISDALRKQLGLLSPEEIRHNREALGLRQRDIADDLGTAEETISRWETGLQIQSRAMDNFLRLYFSIPEVRKHLAEKTAVAPTLVFDLTKGCTALQKTSQPTSFQFIVNCTHYWPKDHAAFDRAEVKEAIETILSLTCIGDSVLFQSAGSILRSWGKIVRSINDDLQQSHFTKISFMRSYEFRHLKRLQTLTENLAEMPGRDRDVVVRSMLPLTSRLAADTSTASHPRL